MEEEFAHIQDLFWLTTTEATPGAGLFLVREGGNS